MRSYIAREKRDWKQVADPLIAMFWYSLPFVKYNLCAGVSDKFAGLERWNGLWSEL